MGSRLGSLAVIATLAAVFAASWHHELWLIPVTMAAAGGALVATERLDGRWLARRAAARALYAPRGGTWATTPEQSVAADLAATAAGDAKLLGGSIVLADATIADPWLRALATERLQLAMLLVAGGGLPPPSRALDVLASWALRFTAMATTLALALAVPTGPHLALVALTISITVLGLGGGEAKRRDALRRLLCRRASAQRQPGLAFMREPVTGATLGELALRRPDVLTEAISLVAGVRGRRRDVVPERLGLALRDARDCRHWTLTFAVLAWAVAAGVATAAVEAL